MNIITRLSCLLFNVIFLHVADGFTAVSHSPRSNQALSTFGIVNTAQTSSILRMSSDPVEEAEKLKEKARLLKEEVAALTGSTVEEMEAKEEEAKAVATTSGDLYDDEVPEYKDPLSDNMRARLMAEASTGLDSNQKQTNVILYISIGVAILVLLGGQGILY